MVVAVSGIWCTLRKFTKAQFRAKTYDVLKSECYLILPTTLTQSQKSPIRGIEPLTDQDSDSETVCAPHDGTLLKAVVQPPTILVQPPTNQLAADPGNAGHAGHAPPMLRRSDRQTKGVPPRWLTDNVWDRD